MSLLTGVERVEGFHDCEQRAQQRTPETTAQSQGMSCGHTDG